MQEGVAIIKRVVCQAKIPHCPGAVGWPMDYSDGIAHHSIACNGHNEPTPKPGIARIAAVTINNRDLLK